MKLRTLFILPLLVIGFLSSASSAHAVNIPDFPSCNNPTGSVVVNYNTGVHGIPGSSGEYVGSDIVYTVSDSQLIQCFCAVNGSGIQTDWWKVDSLNAEQISFLKNLDWIYIPSGTPWGLSDVPYMARNTNINCHVSPQPTPPPAPQPCNGCSGPPTAPVCTSAKPPAPVLTSVVRNGSTAQLTWTAVTPVTNYAIFYGLKPNDYIYGVPNTGNVTSFVIGGLDPATKYYFQVRAVNDCMPSDGSTTGQVLGASIGGGEVLGLASTGNAGLISLLVFAVISFLFLGLVTRKPRRAK